MMQCVNLATRRSGSFSIAWTATEWKGDVANSPQTSLCAGPASWYAIPTLSTTQEELEIAPQATVTTEQGNVGLMGVPVQSYRILIQSQNTQ